MKTFALVSALLAGSAFGAPVIPGEPITAVEARAGPPGNFDFWIIDKPKASGTGCPGNTATVTWDKTLQIFVVDFDQYLVQTGPAPLIASNSVKNCKITLHVGYTKGYTWSILKTEMEGQYSLEAGVTGRASTDVSFVAGIGKAHFEKTFKGPTKGTKDFELPGTTNIIASTCGVGSAILNIDTRISLNPLAPNAKKGYIGVTDIQGHLKEKFHVTYKKC